MKKLFTPIFMLLCSNLLTYGQSTEGTAFSAIGRGAATTFVTDYQSIGINPSNLGWTKRVTGKTVSIGLAEMNINATSDLFSDSELRDKLFNSNGGGFTQDQQRAAADVLSGSGVGFDVQFQPIAFAVTTKKLGGLGFSVSDQISMNFTLGNTVSDIFFEGFTSSFFDSVVLRDGTILANDGTLTQMDKDSVAIGKKNNPFTIAAIFDGTEGSLLWTRQWNLSYGREIYSFAKDETNIATLYGGIGIRYVQGIGLIEGNGRNGQLEGFISTSGPIADLNNPSSDFLAINSSNNGFGFDFGLSAIILDKIKIGASLNNIGSISWEGESFRMQTDTITAFTFSGLEDFSPEESDLDAFNLNDSSFVTSNETKTVSLPSTFRLGASIQLVKGVEAGIDMVIPTNDAPGNIDRAMWSVGGSAQWTVFKLSAGFVTGGNNTGVQIPVGFSLVAPKNIWELGLGTRDIQGFFGSSSNVGLAMGTLRFRF